MKIIASWLVKYIFAKNVIEEDEIALFQYGFQTALEMSMCIVISFIISCVLGMIVEGILFFLTFIPLRSYAGGLHLNHYWSCLFLSCLTFVSILIFSGRVQIQALVTFITVIFMEIVIWYMYPVDNINRKVDQDENIFFKKKLKRFLIFDLIISVVCLLMNKNTYLFVIMMTFFMVAITMVIGKIKNRVQSSVITK